eukprot:TRINITY_DN9340_c0_g1_i1.p1 TRINITY_DN9340_c0_g1~~TRINITY_DN9340_c0_g1_i1.p1  ORF type:complete len:308 (+),score=71.58 TRINITY_DN9340_c0_g1_i1:59-982(+)
MSGAPGPKVPPEQALKAIRNAEIEQRLRQLPRRRRMILTYIFTMFVCTLPSNVAGFVLVFLFYGVASVYCAVPICEWIMIWSAVSILGGLLTAPFYCNPHSRTAMYNIVIHILTMLAQVGLLIWGSMFFFMPGSVSDDCKIQAMPIWYMMLIELVLGYLNVCFFILTIRSSYYSYNLYKLKEAVELAEYEQSMMEMHGQELQHSYAPPQNASPGATYAHPPRGYNTNDFAGTVGPNSYQSVHSTPASLQSSGPYMFAYGSPPPDYGSPPTHRYTSPPFNPDFYSPSPTYGDSPPGPSHPPSHPRNYT